MRSNNPVFFSDNPEGSALKVADLTEGFLRVLNGFKLIDSDGHVIEPDNLYERYLDKRFQMYAPKTRRISPTYPYFATMNVLGHHFPEGHPLDVAPDIAKQMIELLPPHIKAFWPWVEQGFSAASYLDFMDQVGIDHMVLYPTFGLVMMGVPNMEPRLAAAIRRAYNDWLHDYCSAGNGRLHGVGAIDLRDVDLAVAEVRRCVTELGFKSVYILPDPPTEGIPLDHEYYDPLWAEFASLGIPLATHEGVLHKVGNVGYVGNRHVTGTKIPYAVNAVSFGFGEMMAAMMFTGSICARHPDLRVIFNESSVGWAATWLPFLDEKWELYAGSSAVPDHPPSHYFKQQCFISGEAGEEGYSYAVQAGLEDCLLTASDFPHPESDDFPDILTKFFDGRHVQLDDRIIQKVFWDNPSRLFGIK